MIAKMVQTAKQTVKKIIAAGTNPADARVLVMGATFKENVTDIRNSKVADLVCTLGRLGDTLGETHGMVSCAEWTGVLLSTLLKECGLKTSAKWFVAEGAEEIKGASSMPIAKAMDDCIIAYGMNGEAVRQHHG